MKSILYVSDALRYDHLSFAGYSRDTSPNLQDLSSDSVTFSNAYTQSTWTRASAGSILTGMYPPAHGLVDMYDRFPEEPPTLPEILSKEGVHTLGLSAMGNVSSTFGFDAIFDEFVDLYKHPRILEKRDSVESGKLFQEIGDEQSSVVDPTALDVNRFLDEWLTDHADEHFFILVWTIDTHSTFNPLPEFRRFSSDQPASNWATDEDLVTADSKESVEWIRDLYDDAIRQVDHAVGELVERLVDLGIYDETTFVFTGDHGEAFGEHGIYGHATTPYEEIINVPLVLKLPDQRKGGTTVSERVELVDLFPTLADIAGEPAPGPVQGSSLVPLLDDETDANSAPAFSYTKLRSSSPLFVSVTDDDWKYITTRRPTIENLASAARDDPKQVYATVQNVLRYWRRQDGELLFPVDDSVSEDENCSTDNRAAIEQYREIVSNWERACNEIRIEPSEGTDKELDDETYEQLRQMGYIN